MKKRVENKNKIVIWVRSTNCSQESGTLSKVLDSSDIEVKYVKNKPVKYESGIVRQNKSERKKINI